MSWWLGGMAAVGLVCEWFARRWWQQAAEQWQENAHAWEQLYRDAAARMGELERASRRRP